MTEASIPSDIRSNAALAVGPWADPRGELVSRIAQAILAERFACAKIAEENAQIHWDKRLAHERDACLNVSDAIRRR